MQPDYTILLPGDKIPIHTTKQDEEDTSMNESKILLGPGTMQLPSSSHDEEPIATKSGLLRNAGPRFWIESSQRRYVPSMGENVVGVIMGKYGEYYRVDIGSAHPAILPYLAFEGATRRNRPNLEPGTLVYARVTLANKDMEPELDCVNPTTGKADGFGELKDGFVIKSSLGLARSLLNAQSPILIELGKHFAFETAVGMNGKIWINSPSTKQTIAIATAIRNSEFLSAKQIQAMVAQVVDRLDRMDMD